MDALIPILLVGFLCFGIGYSIASILAISNYEPREEYIEGFRNGWVARGKADTIRFAKQQEDGQLKMFRGSDNAGEDPGDAN